MPRLARLPVAKTATPACHFGMPCGSSISPAVKRTIRPDRAMTFAQRGASGGMKSFWPSGVVLGIDGIPLQLASRLTRVFVRTTQQMIKDDAAKRRSADAVEREARD